MRKLGISIYPEKDDIQRIKNYIQSAADYGFTRIFSCLLSAEGTREEITHTFVEVNNFAKALGFEIIVDVAPNVFDKLDISYQDLSFFKTIGADGLRLDVGFTGSEEAMMTFNQENLLIEINMSNDTHALETIMDYQPNRANLLGCHNFYPHRYTGLGLDYFLTCTNRFRRYGLRTAAFITSQNQDTYGPWPVTDGLPTLEIHRHLPLDVQLKHYLTLDAVDDIIISNCFPTLAELSAVGQLDLRYPTFNVTLVDGVPDVERDIILTMLHYNRGDINESMIRSTQSRVRYKGHQFDLFNAPDSLKRGDVIIESSEYGHYAGELQLVKQDMINSGKSNVVGHIRKEEHFILDAIKPWQKFKLQEA